MTVEPSDVLERLTRGAMDFEQLSRIECINVVGTFGSGKFTFARELAELLKLPY